MRIVSHPHFERDIIGMAEHVFAVSGSGDAARRRIADARDLIASIVENPRIGRSLEADLAEWRIVHGGKRRQISIVFRYDPSVHEIALALLTFGRQDWTARVLDRPGFFAGG